MASQGSGGYEGGGFPRSRGEQFLLPLGGKPKIIALVVRGNERVTNKKIFLAVFPGVSASFSNFVVLVNLSTFRLHTPKNWPPKILLGGGEGDRIGTT